MSWLYTVARFLWVLLKLLLNPTDVVMTKNTVEGDSFVKVGDPVQKDFIIKLGIQENGSKKYHRLRLENVLDLSTRQVDFGHLSDFFESRSPSDIRSKGEFTYHDEDGDLCAITTTDDLLEAIKQFSGKGFLKVEASIRDQNQATPAISASSGSSSNPNQEENRNTEGTSDSSSGTPMPTFEERVARARERPTVEREPRPDINDLEDADPEEVQRHLLEEFKDHFNLDSNAIEFFPGDDYGDYVDVMVKYKLNGGRTVKSPFFCMDDVYLDLTTGPHPEGEDLVRMGIPGTMMARIAASVSGMSGGSYYPPDDTTLDPVVIPFLPSIDFKVLNEDLTRVVQGTLQDAIRSEEHRHFYKVSAVFTATAGKEFSGLALELVDLIAFEAHDDVLDELLNMDCGCDDPTAVTPWQMNFTSPEGYDPAFDDDYDPEYDPDYDPYYY